MDLHARGNPGRAKKMVPARYVYGYALRVKKLGTFLLFDAYTNVYLIIRDSMAKWIVACMELGAFWV